MSTNDTPAARLREAVARVRSARSWRNGTRTENPHTLGLLAHVEHAAEGALSDLILSDPRILAAIEAADAVGEERVRVASRYTAAVDRLLAAADALHGENA